MASIVSVTKRKGEDFNKLLARFKKKVKESEHLLELRKRKEYIKPSRKKYIQRQEAIRAQKLLQKQLDYQDGKIKSMGP